MNVLFYYYYLGLGGVEASVLNRIVALKKRGVKAQYWYSKLYCRGAEYISKLDFIHQVDLEKPAFWEDLSQFDVVVIIDFPELVTKLEAAGFRTPVVYESHAAFPPALERYYSVLNSGLIKAVIVPSPFNRELIVNSENSCLEPVVIPNCIDTDDFANVPAPEPICQEVESSPIVLWVGRMGDNKNPIEALEIAGLLERSRPDIQFLMVGDTPRYEEYMQHLTSRLERGLPESARFMRQIKFEQMASIYRLVARSGGLLLSTSRYESSPMTFIESMACQCPILSTDVGGVPWLLDHGRFGMMYQLGEIEDAAEQIDRLTRSQFSAERSNLVRRAYDYVTMVHAPSKVAEQYEKVLSLVSSQRLPSQGFDEG